MIENGINKIVPNCIDKVNEVPASVVYVEIAYLTRDYLEMLENCDNKEQFQKIIEEFDEKKEAVKVKYNIRRTDTRYCSKPWFFHYSGGYSWLVPSYIYRHPDCDLSIFPDILRQRFEDAMWSIAITHRNQLDWFKGTMVLANGEVSRSSLPTETRKLMRDCPSDKDSMITKEYLGENVFLITKYFIPYNGNTHLPKGYRLCFSFDEFAEELNYDLSGANLGDFDISNIDMSKYNIRGIKSKYIIPEEADEQIKLSFDETQGLKLDFSDISTESVLEKNELANVKQTGIATRDMDDLDDFHSKNTPFFYISDLHLCHILQKKKANSTDKAKIVVKKVVQNLRESYNKYKYEVFGDWGYSKVIIGGDISSDHHVFELFINELYAQKFWNVVFILGNHEYWDFSSPKEAVEWYKSVAQRYGYICLHNELLLFNDANKTLSEDIIDGETLLDKSTEEVIKLTENARYILVGGTGFAGRNNFFNAEKGIYRNCLGEDLSEARDKEIKESIKLEKIHFRLISCLSDRQVIVFSHNPLSDWSLDDPCPNWIYVSGHTHLNERKIGRSVRLYADNQVGYTGKNIGLKYFSVETKNCIFEHYKDGIYEINGNKYQEFMDGRNVNMVLNQKDDDGIWMLKCKGYYLFMTYKHTDRNGLVVCVFDGGRKKKVERKPLEYYYDNMLRVVSAIEKPTVTYSKIMKKVSDYVKSFGGDGKIHGSIVDIDTLNHVYVNPNDLTITPYFALNIFERIAFKDIGSLLKDKCPELCDRYNQRVAADGDINNVINNNSNAFAHYDSGTYIYKESNIIKRFDLLRTDKILTNWIDIPEDKVVTGNKVIVKDEKKPVQKEKKNRKYPTRRDKNINKYIPAKSMSIDERYEKKLAQWARMRAQKEQNKEQS